MIYLLILTHNPISRVQQYEVITSIRCFNINMYMLSVPAAIIPPCVSYIE